MGFSPLSHYRVVKGSRFRCIVLLRLLFRFFLSSIVKCVLLLLRHMAQAMSIALGAALENFETKLFH